MIADALLGALHEPFLLEGLRVSVGGSIGVAVCPADADHVEGLLRNADMAMYEAKVRPGSTSRYRGERDRGSAERLVVLTELQSAVDDSQLELYLPAEGHARHRSDRRLRGAGALAPSAPRAAVALPHRAGGRAVAAGP